MARGLVEIQGVTTRVNTSPDRTCDDCDGAIGVGGKYERVARLDGSIEVYDTECFEEEFGPRFAYDISKDKREEKYARWADSPAGKKWLAEAEHKKSVKMQAARKKYRREAREAARQGGLGRIGF